MVGNLSPSEESQLMQTIEMFEVIIQSQPSDYQSLEILKEAYLKLNREQDVINTSRRIAQAYVQLGQLSSAILEYESILQRHPDDASVLAALGEIESKANNISLSSGVTEPVDASLKVQSAESNLGRAPSSRFAPSEVEDGRQMMRKLFVESKVISAADFDACWSTPNPFASPNRVIEPFIQVLADKGTLVADRSLKILCEKTRFGYLPLEKYEIDLELGRSFPAETCLRWCVLPFDRMSKSIFVATANPFNRQAAQELEASTSSRILWYLSPPQDIIKALKKTFR